MAQKLPKVVSTQNPFWIHGSRIESSTRNQTCKHLPIFTLDGTSTWFWMGWKWVQKAHFELLQMAF